MICGASWVRRSAIARVVALAVGLGGVCSLSGSRAGRAESRYPPQLERQVIEELQSRRFHPGNEPADAKAMPWPEWQPTEWRCANAGERAWRALFAEGVCSQLQEDGTKILQMISMMIRRSYLLGLPIHDQLTKLEGAAAIVDTEDAAVKCVARFLAYTWTSDPATRRTADRLAEGVFNLRGLVEFVEKLATLSTGSFEELGEGDIERTGEAWDLAKSPPEVWGWFASLGEALESVHATKMEGIDTRRVRAVASLAACRMAEARGKYASLRAETLAYLAETRDYVVWAEQQAYCAAPSAEDLEATAKAGGDVSARALVDASTALPKLRTADARYREVLKLHIGVVHDPELSERDFAAREADLDRAIAAIRRAQAVRAGDLCDDASVRQAIRDLDRLRSDACQDFAVATVGLQGGIPQLLDSLRAVDTARHVLTQEGDEISRLDAIAACRFGSALAEAQRRLGRFGERFGPFGLSAASFRTCVDPLADLEKTIRRRGEGIAAAERAAEAALAAAQVALQKCDFALARQSLASASGHIGDADCPLSAEGLPCPVDPEACAVVELARQVAALDAQLVAKEARNLAPDGEREAERRAAVAALEALVGEAEGRAPGRCAAIARARGELGRLAALAQGPAECPALGDPSLADLAAAYEQRLAAAERLGADELEGARREAESAAGSCDERALANAAAALEGLPEVCVADAGAVRQTVAALRQRLGDEVRAFRESLLRVDAEWGEAWSGCDLGRLAELQRSIAILAQSPCAARALPVEERTRLDALRELAEEVPAMAQRKATLDARVGAKIRLATGYVRVAEAAAESGAGVHTAAAAQGFERQRAEAEAAVHELEGMADPQLPAICFDPWREQIADLAARIARIRGPIPDAAGGSETPGDSETPSGAEPSEAAPSEAESEPEASAAGDATSVGEGWQAVGGVETLGGNPTSPPPVPAPRAPSFEGPLAAAEAAFGRCNFAAAQSSIARARQLAPEDPYVAEVAARIEALAQRQARAIASLQSAEAALGRGARQEALAALSAAADQAPDCFTQQVSTVSNEVRKGLTSQREGADQRARAAVGGLVGTMIGVWNTGVEDGSPGRGGDASDGRGGGAAGDGTRGGDRYCSIHGSAAPADFYILFVQKPQPNVANYIIVATAADSESATSNLAGMEWISRHSTYAAAMDAARALCPDPVQIP